MFRTLIPRHSPTRTDNALPFLTAVSLTFTRADAALEGKVKMLQIVLPPLLGLISFVVINIGGFLMLASSGRAG
jgi:hypothetical protein